MNPTSPSRTLTWPARGWWVPDFLFSNKNGARGIVSSGRAPGWPVISRRALATYMGSGLLSHGTARFIPAYAVFVSQSDGRHSLSVCDLSVRTRAFHSWQAWRFQRPATTHSDKSSMDGGLFCFRLIISFLYSLVVGFCASGGDLRMVFEELRPQRP